MHLNELISELESVRKFGNAPVVMSIMGLSADITQICHEVDPQGNVVVILDDYPTHQ